MNRIVFTGVIVALISAGSLWASGIPAMVMPSQTVSERISSLEKSIESLRKFIGNPSGADKIATLNAQRDEAKKVLPKLERELKELKEKR